MDLNLKMFSIMKYSYGFWLLIWHLQTLLTVNKAKFNNISHFYITIRESYWTNSYSSTVTTLKILRSSQWFGYPLRACTICLTNNHRYGYCVMSSFMTCDWIFTRVAQWVPLVEQELLTPPPPGKYLFPSVCFVEFMSLNLFLCSDL